MCCPGPPVAGTVKRAVPCVVTTEAKPVNLLSYRTIQLSCISL